MKYLILVVLFAVYPVFFLVTHNMFRFHLAVAVAPAVICSVAAAAVWALFAGISRQPAKASFIISINIAMFFGFGVFAVMLKTVGPVAGFGYKKFYVAMVVLVNALLFAAVKKKSGVEEVGNRILLIVICTSILLSMMTLIVGIGKKVRVSPDRMQNDERLEVLLEQAGPVTAEKKPPDIYHIILDAYSRSDMLREHFGYDNSGFIGFLEATGFTVVPGGWSNYACTDLSIPATLNLSYVHLPLPESGGIPPGLEELRYLKAHSLVSRFCKKLGYTTYITSNGFESGESKAADHFIEPRGGMFGNLWNEFEYGLLRMTPLPDLLNVFEGNSLSFFEQHRRQIRSALQFLSGAYSEKKPKYVFAHIIAPHIPIVFGPHGEELLEGPPYLNDPSADPDKFTAAVRGELIFLDSVVAQTVRSMVQADSNCIIIIQSDHGELAIWPKEKCPEKKIAEQRHGILYAIRTPGYRLPLCSASTAINTYPLLFNVLFGCDIPRLDERVYFSRSSSPLRICEVTELLGLPGYGNDKPGEKPGK